MTHIPPDILKRMHEILLRCGRFRNDDVMRSAFIDQRIGAWRDQLPEAISPDERVWYVIDFLRYQHNEKGENILLLLLDVLADQINPGDSLHHQFTELAQEFRQFLETSEFAYLQEQTSDQATELYRQGQRVDIPKFPENPFFFDRENELQMLSTYAITEGCKLIALQGIGGIGKTACLVNFLDRHKSRFSYIFGRRLNDGVVSSNEFVEQCIKFVSGNTFTDFRGMSWEQKTDQLLELLNQHRCLLLLDNYESLVEINQSRKHQQAELDKYNDLIKQVSQLRHISCQIVTTRSPITEIEYMYGETSRVKAINLQGIDFQGARAIFVDKKVVIDDEELEGIYARFNGHPLALVWIASELRKDKHFLGTVYEFKDIKDIMEWYLKNMTELEKTVVLWLAIEREPVKAESVLADLIEPVDLSTIEMVLARLYERGLVQKSQSGVALQNLMLEFLTEVLVKKIVSEITSGDLDWLCSYALMKATSPEYVRESQKHAIVESVVARLRAAYGETLLVRLETILGQVRMNPNLHIGYAPANLLHLLLVVGDKAENYDFSAMTIRQAYLVEEGLIRFNFRNCHFKQCAFSDSFGWIISLDIDPKGEKVVAGDYSGAIKVWDLSTKRLLWSQHKHQKQWVTSVQFSHDGKYVASCCEGGSVILWDAETGVVLREYQSSMECSTLSISPDNAYLAVGLSNKVIFLNVDSFKLVSEKELESSNEICALAFHPNGGYLAVSNYDKSMRIIDLNTGDDIPVQQGVHREIISAFSFNHAGTLMASCDYLDTIIIWDARSFEPVKKISGRDSGNPSGHSNMLYDLDFSVDDQLLASSSLDTTIKIWDTTNWQCVKTLQAHKDGAKSVRFHPADKNVLISGGYDFSVKWWDLESDRLIHRVQGFCGGIGKIKFSPDRMSFATCGADRTVRMWNTATLRCNWSSPFGMLYVSDVAYSPDGKVLASCADAVMLWDAKTGERVSLGLRDANTGKVVEEFRSKVSIETVCFSPDNEYLLWGDDTGDLYIFDLIDRNLEKVEHHHASVLYTLGFLPKTNMVVSVSDDQTLQVYDYKTRELIFKSDQFAYALHTFACTPAGNRLAVAYFGPEVYVWDTNSWKLIQEFQGAHRDYVRSLSYSLDGKTLFSGGADCLIKAWDAITGEHLFSLSGHEDWVETVVNLDEKTLLSGSDDGTIKVWDLEQQCCVKTIIPERLYEQMNITGAKGLSRSQMSALVNMGAIKE